MNVHLAVPDLLWPDRDGRAAAAPGRFAALETLLARGRRSSRPAAGLEQWLLAAWNTEGPAPHALVAEALELISHKIQALLVVERGQVVGIVNFHDLMRIGAF